MFGPKHKARYAREKAKKEALKKAGGVVPPPVRKKAVRKKATTKKAVRKRAPTRKKAATPRKRVPAKKPPPPTPPTLAETQKKLRGRRDPGTSVPAAPAAGVNMPMYKEVARPVTAGEKVRWAKWKKADTIEDLGIEFRSGTHPDVVKRIRDGFTSAKKGDFIHMENFYFNLTQTGYWSPQSYKHLSGLQQNVLRTLATDETAGLAGAKARTTLWKAFGEDKDWIKGGKINSPERARQYAALDLKAITGKTPAQWSDEFARLQMAEGTVAMRKAYDGIKLTMRNALKERGLITDTKLRSEIIRNSANVKIANPVGFKKSGKTYSKIDKYELDDLKATVVKALDDALDYIPDDLLKNGYIKDIKWQTSPKSKRAYAYSVDNTVMLPPESGARAVFHEFAHHLEYRNQLISDRTENWLTMRGKGLTPTEMYGSGEWGIGDKFYEHYVGSTSYGSGSEASFYYAHTEAVSMGFQTLGDYASFARMVDLDPGHLEHLWSLLMGI
jgi:hypothetical protein